MGICQCIESNNCLSNEIYSERYLIPQNDITQQNEEDLLVKNKHSPINTNGSKFHNYLRNKKVIRNNNVVNVHNVSNRSEIMFENFSYLSNTVESTVDYYQSGKNIFDFINSIRINPKKYVNSINSILNDYKAYNELHNGKEKKEENPENKECEDVNVSNNNVLTTNGNFVINEHIRNYLKEEKNFDNVIEIRDFLAKILESTNRKADLIIWSEKVYLSAYEYLIEVEEKTNMNLDFIQKSSSMRVTEKLKINALCIEFNINGLYPPEITVLFLLLENKERLKNILLDNYSYGAACQFPSKRAYKARTIFYFVNKNNKLPLIMGINPITQKQQSLTLDEPIFIRIGYKHLVIDGTYKSDGNMLYVNFNLINGKRREEEFVLE